MYVAIRDIILAYMNQNPYQALKELGIYSVEIEVDRQYKTLNFPGNNGYPFNLLSEKEVLLKKLEKNRIKICALLMHNNFDTKVKHPWTNGYVERLNKTLLDEFYSVALIERKGIKV